MLQFCFLGLLFILGSSTAEMEFGRCPKVKPMAELEVAPYLGEWYEDERIFMIYEGHQDCNMAIYSDLGNGVVEVHNTGRTERGRYIEIYGTAVVIAPGVLSVTFPGFSTANYTVLGTDYENYSSVFSCEQRGPERFLFGWVLARESPLDSETLAEALKHFTNNGIDISLLKGTYQGNGCPYYKPEKK